MESARRYILGRGTTGGMTGRYTGSYLDRSYGWRAVAILADIGRASLAARITSFTYAFSDIPATSRVIARRAWEV